KIENVKVFGFSGAGIDVETSNSSLTFVTDTSTTNNGAAGVLVKPTAGAAHATLFNVTAGENTAGFLADSTAGGTVSMAIWRSSAVQNSTGVGGNGGGAAVLLG